MLFMHSVAFVVKILFASTVEEWYTIRVMISELVSIVYLKILTKKWKFWGFYHSFDITIEV